MTFSDDLRELMVEPVQRIDGRRPSMGRRTSSSSLQSMGERRSSNSWLFSERRSSDANASLRGGATATRVVPISSVPREGTPPRMSPKLDKSAAVEASDSDGRRSDPESEGSVWVGGHSVSVAGAAAARAAGPSG